MSSPHSSGYRSRVIMSILFVAILVFTAVFMISRASGLGDSGQGG